jgi:nitroimidazol reductase NimA-like FMN-containing flavoprotein (pyridoxamine 5'-phosphate oxidase superfamily)
VLYDEARRGRLLLARTRNEANDVAQLLPLAEEECWRRLSLRAVGRVGFDLGQGPRIHPVNYQVDGTTVLLRTSEDSELARFIQLFSDGALVAFEVDEIDFGWEEGWSILIGGRIERIDSPDERERLHAVWPRPWAPGERNLLARVRAVEITGRAITAR